MSLRLGPAMESVFERRPWALSGDEGNYNLYTPGPISNLQSDGGLLPSSIIRSDLIRLVSSQVLLYICLRSNLIYFQIIFPLIPPRICPNPVIAAP
jgi:hypothetical protein